MSHIPQPLAAWTDTQKAQYVREFQRRYDTSINKEVVCRLRTTACVIVLLVITAVGVTVGSYLARNIPMTSLDLTVCILSTVCFGILGTTAAILIGVYLDLKSLSEARSRETLNMVMQWEHAQQTQGVDNV